MLWSLRLVSAMVFPGAGIFSLRIAKPVLKRSG